MISELFQRERNALHPGGQLRASEDALGAEECPVIMQDNRDMNRFCGSATPERYSALPLRQRKHWSRVFRSFMEEAGSRNGIFEKCASSTPLKDPSFKVCQESG